MNKLTNENSLQSAENNATGNISLESVDFEKLWRVFRKNLIWVLLIFIAAFTVAYTIIRYTKDLFEASSVIQLDVQSDASVLGFRSFDDDINDLSREIELIKSKLFFSKVVEAVQLDVGYFQYGDILYEERYNNNPFEVSYNIKNPDYYNLTFDLEILNKNDFALHYNLGSNQISRVYHFGDTIKNDNFTFFITLTQSYDPKIENKYFFRIYNEQSQINYLASNIIVQPLDFKAKTITIAFKDNNRYKARDVVNAIDTLYIYFTRMEKNMANQQKIDFLNEQLQSTENKLSELETYFENFTIDNRTANLDENLGNTIHIMEELDSQKFIVRHKISSYNKMYDQLISDSDLSLNPSEISALPSDVRQDVDRLDALIEERQVLLGSYNKNTFAYQKKEQEIKFLKDRLVTYLDDTRKSLYQNLDDLTKRRNKVEKEFVGLPSKRTEYTKTQRYYSLYEEFYLSLMKNKAEFELAQAGTVTNFKILSSPTTPSSPISPNKFLIYGIGFVAAFILSFFLIGINYLLNNKVTSTQQLEKITSLPVIGSIPLYRNGKTLSTRLVVDKNPKSEITEAFRSIRSNLEFLRLNGKKTIISITSTISGEGKTFIAVNLGGIISMLDNKVILLDLDMRKPKIQKVFYDQEVTHGISTILINKHEVTDCIKKTDLDNLDYIPSGPIPPNPSELVHNSTFDRMIEELKSIYDVIIIDTPPVGLVTDGLIAMKKANIPLFILRADFSRKNFLKGISKFVKTQKISQLSIILNAIKGSNKNGYGYGYYHDNGYYDNGKQKKKKKLVPFLPSFLH